MHHFGIILQIHCAIQGTVALGKGRRGGLTVQAEMLAVERLFEIAMTGKNLQPISCRQMFDTKPQDTLGDFAFDGERF